MDAPVYSLIAFDLDGTLLSPEHALSARARAALTSLIARRYHVVIATGRPFELVRQFCPGVPFTAPQITYNGAVVYDPVEDRTLSQSFVPPHHVTRVIDFLLGAGIPVVVCASDCVYLDERITNPEDWILPAAGRVRYLTDIRDVPAEGLIKIVGVGEEAAIARIRPAALATFAQALYVTQTAHTLLEFLNPDVSKGAALCRIAELLGITRDEILVFGDSHNDLTMFRVAGLSVAMGNASEEVKDAADRLTLTNEDDGVPVVLEELGLVDPFVRGEYRDMQDGLEEDLSQRSVPSG